MSTSETGPDIWMQMQTATEDGDEDPKEEDTEGETILNSCGKVELKVHKPQESS